jgi:hypothetical protein
MKSLHALVVVLAMAVSPLNVWADDGVPEGWTPIANASVLYGDNAHQALIYQDGEANRWQTVVPGTNVRCPESPSVYWIGGDGQRYVYPMEYVFTSRYHPSAQKVVWLPCSTLDLFPFGGRMPLRAGSLVKTQLNPKVYVVMGDQELRAIPDEETALALFGERWAQLVFDLPETFFTDYTVGEELTVRNIPDGLLGQSADGTPAVSWKGEWRQIDWNSALVLRFHDTGSRYHAVTDQVKSQLVKQEGDLPSTVLDVPGLLSRVIGNPWSEVVAEEFPVVYGNVY